tara:strand:+ start:194 stop:910 length:717 start_codon:yes stop_codon:yes gene_type:complete
MKYSIDNLREYFINDNNIFTWTSNIIENKKQIKKPDKKDGNVKSNNSDKSIVFYEKDPLFWCFYFILYGEFDYTTSHSSFVIEKQIKISFIEKVRNSKKILKTLKIKPNYIENVLLCSKKIDILTFYTLCHLHNINFIIQDRFFYWENNVHIDPTYHIIKFNDNKPCLYVKNYIQDEVVEEIKAKCIQSQLKSKIKTISNYKISDIHDICKKLSIEITNKDGKKKNKKILYNHILEYI